MSLLGEDYKANSRLRLLVHEMSDVRPEYAELHKILSETVIDLSGTTLPDGSLVGKVTTLFPEKGYGFIEYIEGQDYYFHVSHLVAESDWVLLEPGTLVSFQNMAESQESNKKKSPTATAVRILIS